MTKSNFLEWFNCFFAIMALCACTICAIYLVRDRGAGWRALRPVVALFLLFLGIACTRGGVATVRFMVNHDTQVDRVLFYSIHLIGGGITLWGILCCIITFSDERWGRKPWIFSLLMALVTSFTVLWF